MNLAELSVAPPQRQLIVLPGGEVTAADLELVKAYGSRGHTVSPRKRLTERHHASARLLAAGTTPGRVAIITGLTRQSITLLQNDPSFKELVAYYRDQVEDEYRGMHAQLAGLGVDALEEIRNRLEEEPEKIGFNSLMEIVKITADRTGHGPSSSTKAEVNVTVGLADRLAEARKRANAAIEGRARDITPEQPGD